MLIHCLSIILHSCTLSSTISPLLYVKCNLKNHYSPLHNWTYGLLHDSYGENFPKMPVMVKPQSQKMHWPGGSSLMDRNRRKTKSLGSSRHGWKFFQLWSYNRCSPCGNPLFSITARQHCVLLWSCYDLEVTAWYLKISQSPQVGCVMTER